VAICYALGFGPDKWAAFLLAGMPFLITPGVARLALLLLGSLTLLSLLWPKIIGSQPIWLKIASAAGVCLPFIVGSFYVAATPRTQRHLETYETNQSKSSFGTVKNDVPTITIGYSSGDEPAVYSGDFIDVLSSVGITSATLPMYAEGNECGVMVGAIDVNHPSDKAQKVAWALRNSGFSAPIAKLASIRR